MEKILIALILLTPFMAMSKGIKLTSSASRLPFVAGTYILQFDNATAEEHEIATWGFAGGAYLNFTFNKRYESSIGYNYAFIGDHSESNDPNYRNNLEVSHFVFLETGLTHNFSKVDLSLLIGTEKIFITREKYGCTECDKTRLFVPEGVFLRPIIKLWAFKMPFSQADNEFMGFYIDYQIGLNKRLVDNQFSLGLMLGERAQP